MKINGFANSVGLDEAAHQKPPHLDLNCLTSTVFILLLDGVYPSLEQGSYRNRKTKF